MSILRDLHVIEISANGSAAMAAKLLADWGARVTILEPRGGTPLRNEPPYYEIDGEQRSAAWAWLSRGKTSVRPGGEEALRLCERADLVLVESEMSRDVLGLASADVRGRFEGVTNVVLISPFSASGQYSHYQATDLGINALGGWMSVMGLPDREPLSAGRNLIGRITGVYAFVASLIALRYVRQGGAPQFAELSAQAVAASMISAPWLIKSMAGFSYERTGNTWPLGAMECADGHVGIPPLTAMHWELLCGLMGLEDELEAGRDIGYRNRHANDLYERVRPWLAERTRTQVFEEAQAWRLPAAPVETISERLECPQLEARGFWQPADIEGRTLKVPRPAFAVKGLASVERGSLREANAFDLPERVPSHASNAALPYAGLRVLDLTTFWSGPSATSLIGALGADVIKVESIQRPDPYRYQIVNTKRERWWEWSPVFNDCNPNKRGITLDLSSQEGKALFERLVPLADVVVSNFSNRVMPNLGLTNERLRALNPNLIAVTMPGYGLGGPWGNYVGYAIAFELLNCAEMIGYPDGPPMYAGGFCDPLVGMHVVAAVDLALRQREETGAGTEVEVPQCEVLETLLAPEHIAVQLGASDPVRRGNRHDWMAPHGCYRVAGDDSWLTLAVSSDEEFAALCDVLNLALDTRFATVAARNEHEEALDALLAPAIAERDGVELEEALQGRGVKACRVVKGPHLADDAGLLGFGLFTTLEREVTGSHLYKRWPFSYSGLDTSHKRVPPLLGQHTNEVLSELPGLSNEDLAGLRSRGVIGNEPVGA